MSNARIILNEMSKIEKVAERDIFSSAKSITTQGLRAFRDGISPTVMMQGALNKFKVALIRIMTTAHLFGTYRTLLKVSPKLRKYKQFANPYTEATEFVRKRMDLSSKDIAKIEKLYTRDAVNVTRGLGNMIEMEARKVSLKMVAEGMHVQQGIAEMKKAFEAQGIVPSHPYLLENLVRTQISLAYNAGRWSVNQEAAVQEILWGYEYVTVGDDRVRPNHAAMDGIKLPKDDSFWKTNWPPNGYSCRCSVIEIFIDESPKEKRAEPMIDESGNIIKTEADIGWAFNPGIVRESIEKTIAPLKTIKRK